MFLWDFRVQDHIIFMFGIFVYWQSVMHQIWLFLCMNALQYSYASINRTGSVDVIGHMRTTWLVVCVTGVAVYEQTWIHLRTKKWNFCSFGGNTTPTAALFNNGVSCGVFWFVLIHFFDIIQSTHPAFIACFLCELELELELDRWWTWKH